MVGRPSARWWRFAAGAALLLAGAGAAAPGWAHEGGLTTVTVPPVAVTIPEVALPDLATPELATPPLSTPVATVPPVTLPPVTLPPVTLPPLQVGGAVAPTATGPATDGGTPSSAGAGTPAPAPGTTSGPQPATPPSPATAGPDAGPADGAATAATEPAPLAVRLRRAAAETVGQLSFPLGLAVAIAGFLLVQHRLDRDDPRVAPPALGDDELLEFS